MILLRRQHRSHDLIRRQHRSHDLIETTASFSWSYWDENIVLMILLRRQHRSHDLIRRQHRSHDLIGLRAPFSWSYWDDSTVLMILLGWERRSHGKERNMVICPGACINGQTSSHAILTNGIGKILLPVPTNPFGITLVCNLITSSLTVPERVCPLTNHTMRL